MKKKNNFYTPIGKPATKLKSAAGSVKIVSPLKWPKIKNMVIQSIKKAETN